MNEESLAALLGVFGTIIVALLTFSGRLLFVQRRDNKNHPNNPGAVGDRFATVAEANKGLLLELSAQGGRLETSIEGLRSDVGSARDILIEIKTILDRR